MNATGNTWPWKLLLAVILIVMAAAVGGAVKQIDYEWRWYRVPQYFPHLLLYKGGQYQLSFSIKSKKTSSREEALYRALSLTGSPTQSILPWFRNATLPQFSASLR